MVGVAHHQNLHSFGARWGIKWRMHAVGEIVFYGGDVVGKCSAVLEWCAETLADLSFRRLMDGVGEKADFVMLWEAHFLEKSQFFSFLLLEKSTTWHSFLPGAGDRIVDVVVFDWLYRMIFNEALKVLLGFRVGFSHWAMSNIILLWTFFIPWVLDRFRVILSAVFTIIINFLELSHFMCFEALWEDLLGFFVLLIGDDLLDFVHAALVVLHVVEWSTQFFVTYYIQFSAEAVLVAFSPIPDWTFVSFDELWSAFIRLN